MWASAWGTSALCSVHPPGCLLKAAPEHSHSRSNCYKTELWYFLRHYQGKSHFLTWSPESGMSACSKFKPLCSWAFLPSMPDNSSVMNHHCWAVTIWILFSLTTLSDLRSQLTVAYQVFSFSKPAYFSISHYQVFFPCQIFFTSLSLIGILSFTDPPNLIQFLPSVQLLLKIFHNCTEVRDLSSMVTVPSSYQLTGTRNNMRELHIQPFSILSYFS